MQFIVSHNLVVQMRLFKKAKDKQNILNLSNDEDFLETKYKSNFQNESNLVEIFFDLEAEIEKIICRDQVSNDSKEDPEFSKNCLNSLVKSF